MQTIDLRIDAGWIVPIEPQGVLAGHALLIDAGRVVAILPCDEASRRFTERQRVTLPHHALMPGLINAHTHAAMTLFRGIAEDVPLQVWLEERIWPREVRFVTSEFIYDGTLLAGAEMLKRGVTCFNDMYFYPGSAARACLDTGIRAMLGIVVLDFPTSYAADPDAYLEEGFAVRDEFRATPGLYFALAPHAPYTVSNKIWERVVMYARELQLPIHTHIAETAFEVRQSHELHGESPLARLHRLGATGPGFVGAHGVHLDATDIELLATHGGSIVHCPVSNMKLACGIAPVAALRKSGVNVAFGTDSAASASRLDIFDELRTATLLAKVANSEAAMLPAAEALSMATLGAACALGLDDRLGSLLPGKEADVVAIDLSAPEIRPWYDLLPHLVHVSGSDHVTDVWVHGRRVVADRRLTTIDEASLLARTNLWQERLQ